MCSTCLQSTKALPSIYTFKYIQSEKKTSELELKYTNMSCLITFLALLLVLSSNTVTGQIQLGQPGGQASIPCNQVINELSPCLPYLHNQYSSPSTYCCQGAKYVWKHFAQSKKKRQGVCQCLESVLPIIGQIDGSLISALPKQCGLKLKLPPISPNFKCSHYM
ncbi:probable non-specific lipid-transfer protein 2 isoform X2 [Chenopodium quinoa]|uniref:probable non-specific lipid-transfer protein 2 isoform X2 n=1 Tax=Chenopodium quinoa TaxID=63459 RepID=UPI000B77FBC4|nr:probable non-specific lipid-transfer protein 2 isoform X2 [Chenopodium quinoa]